MSAVDDRPASMPGSNVSRDLTMSDPTGTSASASNEERKDTAERTSHKEAGSRKSSRVCRFFQSKAGCRAGDACRYQHVSSTNTSAAQELSVSSENMPSTEGTSLQVSQRQRSDEPDAERHGGRRGPQMSQKRLPIAKPVPRAQQANPREFQIGQVIRRFKPIREDMPEGSTVLSLSLTPSDPDFPFELDSLQCKLNIPGDWPSPQTKPSIKVENSDIPKGYQINIERGFDTIASSGKTLLALLNDLDRSLERFLSTEKAQTIKIVAHRRKEEPVLVEPATAAPPMSVEIAPTPRPSWSNEQKSLAKEKREADIRQLEARMGRLPQFSASNDKTLFTVPLQYPKPARLPVTLQPLKEIALTVPLLYDLEPCSIKLKGVSGSEVPKVEAAFAEYAQENHKSTLMAHVNYLTQHLPDMAVATKVVESDIISQPPESKILQQGSPDTSIEKDNGVADEERPHLIFLSRPPPEWNRTGDDADDSSESNSEEYDSEEDEEDDSSADEGQEGGASVPLPASSSSSNLEKGVLFSFPHLETTGIELLEVHSLSLTVKCDRCKSLVDFRNIKPADSSSDTSIIRTETCNKCASPLSASYRAEPLHANSIKAGFLDIEGCTVQDMLPSTFLPTCSDCSTTQPLPGTTAVRGDTTLIVCRTCHRKMTMHIQEVKFLRVSTNDARLNRPLAPKRKKENLGITSGTELPERGRCKHYGKSFRWFRFSCCNRVYACDRCHDENEAHPNEHANRMICGWCSREQNYRPEDCQFCQRSVVRKAGGGFWEGGKGTRDRVKMNRNDPRKYKRIGGTTAGEKKK